MSNPQILQNQQSLQQLIRILTLSQAEFSLILAHCSYETARNQIVQELHHQSSVPIQELDLHPSTQTLDTTISRATQPDPPAALMVFGLETVTELDRFLEAIQLTGEELYCFPFPLVLWVTDSVLQKIIRLAPNLYSRATSVSFSISTGELVRLIQTTVDRIFSQVLTSNENVFLDNVTLGLAQDSPQYAELQTAYHELNRRGHKLSLKLSAGLEFVLGRIANNTQITARKHYEKSLQLWQRLGNRERQGHLLFYLGLWWLNYAVQHFAEGQSASQIAENYLYRSLQSFQVTGQLGCVAKFINFLCEALHRLEDWPALETQAKRALELYQTYPNLFRQARTYGFLAEVELARNSPSKAHILASKALSDLALAQSQATETQPLDLSEQTQVLLDWELSFNQGWYLFSLGKAQILLKQFSYAVETLESAHTKAQPSYDPLLYIGVLKFLSQAYYQQKDYLKAFEIKREWQAVEGQFGLRAFVGANRLRPRRQVTTPVVAEPSKFGTVAQEIRASRRQQDLDCLITRMKRNDHRLLIVHGQSGVGKSSILQAGLIPSLWEQVIDARSVLPVMQRVYQPNWAQELGNWLQRGLTKIQADTHHAPFDSSEKILQQLQRNSEGNLLTVLIFDQFEELFFTCQKIEERRPFYGFLKACLNIPYVKVVLALREDYLHFLLECNNRLVDFDIVSNNILDQKILYHLGNFEPDETESLIRNLTKSKAFRLEEDLIERLVEDLSEELGQVRPIELQIVGAKLQNESITTLKQYEQLSTPPKSTLVNSYLDDVVHNCGPENQRMAELILYLLTDVNELRPPKTQSEISRELRVLADYPEQELEKIDFILEIFVKSRLVTRLKQFPVYHYQLIHDYLVSVIRQRQGQKILEDLSHAQKRQDRLQQLLFRGSTVVAIAMLALAGFAWVQKTNAIRQENQAILSKLNARHQLLRLIDKNQLDSLVTILRAGRQLQSQTRQSQLSIAPDRTDRPNRNDTEQETISHLWRSVYFTSERNRLEEHRASVTSVDVSADGQLIASASSDQTVKLWRPDGAPYESLAGYVVELIHPDEVWSVSFSPEPEPNQQQIATASKDKKVRLWNLDGEIIWISPDHGDAVRWVSFSPDGQMIASASEDRLVRLWNREDGQLIKVLSGHTDIVLSVTFSPDGQQLASASKDGTIRLWTLDNLEAATTKPLPVTVLKGHQNKVNSVIFSPDSQTIASASEDYTVKLWNRNGQSSRTIKVSESPVNSVVFLAESFPAKSRDPINPDASAAQPDEASYRLATASSDGQLRIWTEDGGLISTLPGHSGAANRVTSFLDRPLLVSAGTDRSVRLWNLSTTPPTILQPDAKVLGQGATFSPDGELIAAASDQNTIGLWRLKQGTTDQILKGHEDRVTSIDFSPSGEVIASGSADQTVKLWNRQGKLLRTLIGNRDQVRQVQFSPQIPRKPEEQLIASAGGDGTIRFWTVGGKALFTITRPQDPVVDLGFSPSGERFVSASNSLSGENKLSLWRQDGSLITEQVENERFSALRFSPVNENLIAAAMADHTIRLWRIEGDKLVSIAVPSSVQGHRKTVYQISFSPNGQLIASASADGTVKLWDKTGKFLVTLQEGSELIEWVGFNSKGQLTAIDNTNQVRTWDTKTYQINRINDLDFLLNTACFQVSSYLKNNPKVDPVDQQLCQQSE
ncbi:MAG: WD40 repeat domain-containing protein [Microcoleaceae cyanobacterium]